MEVIPTETIDLASKFKDSLGRYRTQSLFLETNDIEDKYPSYFTLKPYDHKGRISLRRKYLEIADPTEYSFAIKMLGYWEHWQKLAGLGWFLNEYLTEWREELDKKLQSQAIEHIKNVAELGVGPAGLSAAKWLAEKKYSSTGTKRGRPSKDEIAGIRERVKVSSQERTEDARRIGLVK